jgi:hypothetical protein
MNAKQKLFHFLVPVLFLPAVCLGDKLSKVVDAAGRRDEQLQAAFLQFPILNPATNEQGQVGFKKIDLNAPVLIDGIRFYGFRFKVPKRAAKEDFVWSFGEPGLRHFWYITPQSGSMAGFENFFREPRAAYRDLGQLFPMMSDKLVIQYLSGDSLEDEKEYLIWLAFGDQRPDHISVAITFAKLPNNKARNRGALERVLGLHRKPKE